MDKLYLSAKYYQDKLEGRKYLLLACKKNNFLLFQINFNKDSFKHLIGLHKLIDLGLKETASDTLFTQILNKELTYEKIQKSSFFQKILNRIDNFEKIGEILSSPNDMRKSLYGSFGKIPGVKADYLLSKKHDKSYIHLFFKNSGKNNDEIVLPVTFFLHKDATYIFDKDAIRWNIVTIEELTEKDDVKRKAELMELKAKLSTSTSRSFDEMREIVRDTVHVRSSNTKNNDKDEHDD